MKFITKKLQQIWVFMKKFPFTCYGVFSMLSFNIFSYDFFILGLLMALPFIYFSFFSIKPLLYFESINIMHESHLFIFDFIIYPIYCVTLTVILDIFIRKKLIPFVRKYKK